MWFSQDIDQVTEDVNEPIKKSYKHAFGVGAGFTSGIGFTYKYMPDKFGVQLRALPFKDNDVTFLSTGLTFRYNIYSDRYKNVFLYQGNHFFYKEETDLYYPGYDDFYYDDYYEATTITSSYSTAVGVGIEFLMG